MSAPERQPGRGPVVLEPIVLPPEAAQIQQQPPPPAPAAAPRRGPPLRPLLQRPNQDGDAPRRWWSPDSDDDDDEDGWKDLERSMPSLLQHGSPDCLPMDHTLPHLLRQVAGTQDLQSVQSIKLRVVGREMSLQRLCAYMPNLTELNLDASSVGSLRELGCGLSGLRVLRVTRCGLDSLDGTFGLPALAELYAAYNRVQDIGYLACLPSIEHIDLRGNRVHDIRYAGFLSICPLLRELVLAENPCSDRSGYRAAIREMLPGLAYLDGVALSNYEQDDDTDTFTEGADDSDGGLDANDQQHEEEEEAAEEEEGREEEQVEGEEEDVDVSKRSTTPSETEDSFSSSSASSRGGAVDAAGAVDAVQLWTRAMRKAAASYVHRGEQRGPSTAEQHSTRAVVDSEEPAALTGRVRPLLPPRPATASCATPRRPRPGPTSLPWTPRPSSAAVPSDYGASSVVDGDAPSPLTSGVVVCGNLSLALRKARRRKEAWGQPLSPPSSASLGQGRCGGGSSSSSSSSWSPVESVDLSSGSSTQGPVSTRTSHFDSESLLTASRKWRDTYHVYRARNKLKWKEEEEVQSQQDATST